MLLLLLLLLAGTVRSDPGITDRTFSCTLNDDAITFVGAVPAAAWREVLVARDVCTIAAGAHVFGARVVNHLEKATRGPPTECAEQ